jgi:hypothetical protein
MMVPDRKSSSSLVSLGSCRTTWTTSVHYQIKGAGDEKVRYACGVDLFQALHLALSTLAVELEVLNRGLGGKLRWECDETGTLGFPGFAASL